MSAKIQHKLLNLEVQPPPDTWEKIASRLTSEFDSSDSEISRKIAGIEITPPASIMDSLFEALDKPPVLIPASEKARVLHWNFRRLAVAAAVTAIISFSAYYILSGKQDPANNAFTSSVPDPGNPQTSSIVTVPDKSPEKPETSKAVSSVPASVPLKTKPGRSVRSSYPRYNKASVPVSYASIPVLDKKDPETKISVSAPPIRDKKGNLILDRKLITSAPEGYIFVTGPNGMKTKLSRKFIDMISYLNESMPTATGGRDAIKWEQKFEEWRNLLLNQPAFMPAGGNYLDILELKDLIQNNNNY